MRVLDVESIPSLGPLNRTSGELAPFLPMAQVSQESLGPPPPFLPPAGRPAALPESPGLGALEEVLSGVLDRLFEAGAESSANQVLFPWIRQDRLNSATSNTLVCGTYGMGDKGLFILSWKVRRALNELFTMTTCNGPDPRLTGV